MQEQRGKLNDELEQELRAELEVCMCECICIYVGMRCRNKERNSMKSWNRNSGQSYSVCMHGNSGNTFYIFFAFCFSIGILQTKPVMGLS